jgi:phosphomannomutase
MTKHVFHPSILRAYDIRGIVDETLTLNDAKAIGIAFCGLPSPTRAMAIMSRLAVMDDYHHPLWQAALCDGLVAGGARVSDIGCGPTPMLYYAGVTLNANGRHSSNRIA